MYKNISTAVEEKHHHTNTFSMMLIKTPIYNNELIHQGQRRKSVDTDKTAALDQIKLEFGTVGFCGGRKTGDPEEKPLELGENQQQTQPP